MLIEAPKLKKTFLDKIEAIYGENRFSITNTDRICYSRDSNFKSVIRAKYNKLENLADLIVWPKSTEEIAETIKLCARYKMPVVPYGAGSGVSGGTIPVRGGVIIDIKKMNRLLKLDESNLLATVEAGAMGLHFEEELARRGYTLGHFPSSILCASVGGYLAARSAGQLSSRYGKIEDMVRSLVMVSGKGELIETKDIANKKGLDITQLLVGTEGAFGVITQATLKVFPLAEYRAFRGIRFKNVKTAMEAIRRTMQAGLRPAVVRLYDELDTMLLLSAAEGKSSAIKLPSFFKGLKDDLKIGSLKAALTMPRLFNKAMSSMPIGCLLVLMYEGHERIVQEEQKIVTEISTGLGGEDLGEDPGLHWYKHRYSVSYNASKLFSNGLFTDTIEIAASWDNLLYLYNKMTTSLSKYCVIMAHLSHVYSDGGSLYFTFAAPLKGLQKSEELYDLIWHKAMQITIECGGTISHHHGIGRLKSEYMWDEWGDGVEVMRHFKKYYDPHGIMNPGKLLPGDSVQKKMKVA